MTGKEAIDKFMHNWGRKREVALSFRTPYDATFQEIDSFMRGEQWNDVARRNNWTPRPVNNILHLVQQAKLAKISESKLITKLLPLSSEDNEIVDDMQSLMDSYWKHSDVTNVINDVKSDSRSFPIGYIKVSFDGSALVGTKNNIQKGDFNFECLKPTNVYWDPRGYDTDAMEFIYETKKVSMEDLMNTPKYDQEVVGDIKEYVESKTRDDGEVLDRNYDLQDPDNKTFTLYVISFRWKPSTGADYKYGEIHTVSKGFVNKESKGPELIPLWSKSDLKIKRHPIIPLREFKNTHEFIGKSTVQVVLNKQKSVNKVDSIIANIADQLSNQQKIVAVESGIDPEMLAKYGNAAGLVISTKTDVNNSVAYMKPPEIPATLVQHKRESKEDIYEVANITPASLGKNVGSITTAGGVNAMIGQGNGMETNPKANYKVFVEKVYRTMMEFIVGNFKKISRRIDNHDPDQDISFGFKEFDISKFKDKDYDMYIDVRATAAEIVQQKQEVMQILGLQAQTGEKILSEATIIDLMDFPDKDRILANYYDRKNEKNATGNEIMRVATQAAMMMAQEIHNNEGDNDNVSIQEMAQMAARQAMQSKPMNDQNAPRGSTAGAGQGAGAPQPAAQAAKLQQTGGQ